MKVWPQTVTFLYSTVSKPQYFDILKYCNSFELTKIQNDIQSVIVKLLPTPHVNFNI